VPTARAASPPPLPGCTPLFTAAAMRDADARAGSDHAMPSVLLMERAGLASAQAIRERHPGPGAALVLAGPGNNGGDGMVVARHLAEAGWHVEVAAPDGRAPASADAGVMSAVAASLGLAVRALDPSALAEDHRVVVDALLGTGSTGAPRGAIAPAVEALAARRGPTVSLDLPSGVDADSGRAAGPAARADLTVTYHGDKVGLRVEPGRSLAGEVVVADIGIPSAVALDPAAWLAGAGAAALPPKAAAGDKYRAGSVLVVAGSPGLTGAGIMTSRATLRAGAGLTVAAVPRAVQPVFAAHLLEVMAAPVPDEDGCFAPVSVDEVVRQAARAGALALGPGLGRASGTTAFTRRVLEAVALPAVVDADGLWHLGERPEWLRGRGAATVLTPHAGEAARLLGRRREEVEADRLACARELAEATGAVVVLKGAGTITCAPQGPPIVNGTGTPALATAGSGDVLTGVVAAALAKGMDPLAGTAAAVAAHGRAAELAGGGDGLVAGDVIEALPRALAAR
jgi:ADP-dependent NAD(P)H-hydrate dehydratase / NAD(P)H-hydrate epimerase